MYTQVTALIYFTENTKITYIWDVSKEYNYVLETALVKYCTIIVTFILVRLYADVLLNKKRIFIDFRK